MAYPTGSESRRDRILDAAARAFATHGYEAASLRDIAKDADCSLTLVDHHFGNKSLLLHAVVESLHVTCRQRMKALTATKDLPLALSLADFIDRWVGFEFDQHATRDGRQYLMLMLRLSADLAVDSELRRTLNCAESVVMNGLRRARPQVSADSLRTGWQMASAALYSVMAAASVPDVAFEETPDDVLRNRATAFVVGGLEAAWALPDDDTVADAETSPLGVA